MAGGGSANVTGSLAKLSSSCAIIAGTCNDSSNLMNLNQQYSGATGAVELIQNAGTGFALQIQDSSNNTLFAADTTKKSIAINTTTETATLGVRADANSSSSAYTSAGSNNFVVPNNVTSVTVTSWGAGGGGGGGSASTGTGGAGGGGGFIKSNITVTPGRIAHSRGWYARQSRPVPTVTVAMAADSPT